MRLNTGYQIISVGLLFHLILKYLKISIAGAGIQLVARDYDGISRGASKI